MIRPDPDRMYHYNPDLYRKYGITHLDMSNMSRFYQHMSTAIWGDLKVDVWHQSEGESHSIRVIKGTQSWPVTANVREWVALWITSPYRKSLTLQEFVDKLGL